MVISESLLGPAQCTPEDELSRDGASPALEMMRWIFAGTTFDAFDSLLFASPSSLDRARVLAVLDLFPLQYCNPPSKKAALHSITVIIAACLSACGFFVCAVMGAMQLQRRRLAKMLAQAQVKLPENVQEVLDKVWATIREKDGGACADYIPELATADPTPFAIVLCGVQTGALYETGDATGTKRFTLQSACKPLLYCLALEDNGQEAVDLKVGSEPTGGPFNVVSFDTQGRPYNPYAGAICTTGLVAGASAEERFRRTSSLFNAMSLGAQCGTSLDVSVYDSEMDTNANNQTIVNEALKRGLIASGQGQVALEAYTMACSLSVDCRETGEAVLPEWVVNRTVSTMMTCGMYNGAGAWMVEVGIPASKSGVGGVIMCVVPGICGFAAFSPRLDQNGNSTRGVLVARELSDVLSLHVLHKGGEGGPSKDKAPSKNEAPSGGDASTNAPVVAVTADDVTRSQARPWTMWSESRKARVHVLQQGGGTPAGGKPKKAPPAGPAAATVKIIAIAAKAGARAD
ncbi:beta-lactamase/transpeptidase-like protein [Pelagophyceae sp. CCMP2097]|nr:beta-lactamase/transpeptidase-like protein [Pelagophyceae sp. CCMP2097]